MTDTERKRIARFLNLEADHQLLHARIRGFRSVEMCRAFLAYEADHQARQSDIAAINQRQQAIWARGTRPDGAETDAGRTARTDGGDARPRCGACEEPVSEQSVAGERGWWCPEWGALRRDAEGVR
jgi:hypothetical protein